MQVFQSQIDALLAPGVVASSADRRAAVRLIGSRCIQRDAHGNDPRVTTPECIASVFSNPEASASAPDRYGVVSLGLNAQGQTLHVVFNNGLAGTVIGTVSTYTGLPGIVAAAPAEKASAVTQYAPPVIPQSPRADGSIVHVVQPGDTVWTIAVAYGVSTRPIVERNQLSNDGRIIQLGQELLIRDAT